MNTNETWEETSDYKNAILFANAFLDEPYRDPDGNESTVARQFLRQIERTEYYRDLLSKERREMVEAIEKSRIKVEVTPEGVKIPKISDKRFNDGLDFALALYKDKDK